MKLHPDLLRACAAYLAHADAYCLDSDDQMALLRCDARRALESRRIRDVIARALAVDAVDELTHAHLEAIRRHARLLKSVGHQPAVARAILDATPTMLEWWCARLA